MDILLCNNKITRVAGIEPTHAALKAAVLPLNYTPLYISLNLQDFYLLWLFFQKKYYLVVTRGHGLTEFRSPLLSFSQLIFKYKVNELVHFTLLV